MVGTARNFAFETRANLPLSLRDMPRPLQKILIIRLSSIGDIVLTSPVIRSLRACYPNVAIHFVTKAAYAPLLVHHPDIDRLHLFSGNMDALITEMKAENFDFILDLHRNLRSRIIKLRLRKRSATYPKDRWPVLLYTRFRVGQLPKRHTVERYGQTLRALGCDLDTGGLDFFVPDEVGSAMAHLVRTHFGKVAPIAVVLGGNFATKKWPNAHFITLLNALGQPVLLLGGPGEAAAAAEIEAQLKVVTYMAVGQHNLLESAGLMAQCQYVITHDTGLMHIAIALGLRTFSLWGSTVPEIGFSPYRSPQAVILQHPGLDCRPCSKLGHDKCPKTHFKCMRELTPAFVLQKIQASFSQNSATQSLP
ncbi:MAG TPA: glycosyltransferase family 9 protein [Bacteroidetes bacterium]|nr:glycosyltransferase family 9 protein [Bacteroidota bacterium]